MPLRQNLALKIILPLLFLMLLSGLGISFSVFHIMEGNMFQNLHEQTLNRTKNIIRSIDQKLVHYQNILHTIDKTAGMDLLSPEKSIRKLAAIKANYPEIQTIFISDTSGLTSLSNGKTTNIFERDYFQAAISGQNIISNPIVGKVSGNPLITIATALHDSNGISGVVGMAIELSALSELVNSEPFGQSGYSFLIDQQGIILCHPNKDLIMTQGDFFFDPTAVTLRDTITRMQNQETGIAYYRYKEHEKLVAFMPLGTNGWSVGSSVNLSEVRAPIDLLRIQTIFIHTASFLVLFIVMYLFFYKSIIKRIRTLKNNLNTIIEGSFEIPDSKNNNDEIAALQLDFLRMSNTIKTTINDLKNKESTLQSVILERETMFHEIHHRVKNNFSTVIALLNLQKPHLESEEARHSITEATSRIYAMALVHETLYSTKDFASILIADYVTKLVAYIDQTSSLPNCPVTRHIDVCEVRIDLDRAIPLGLLVNEFLTNTYKHAFKDRQTGFISIAVRVLEPNLIIEYLDDGIGLSDTWSFERDKNLGMEIIHALVKQLDGKLAMESNNGLHYTLHIPMQNHPEATHAL